MAFVSAWAPYASMRTLTRDIATATSSSDGAPAPWQVDHLTRKVYVRTLTDVLDPDEADRLRTAYADRGGQVDVGPLSADGRAVYPLLTALAAGSVEAALERLPAALQERLDAMSPIGYLKDIRAPLITLAHDRDDPVIPIAESRRLRAALAGRAGVRYTEFTMFKHLDPTRVRLPLVALIRELGKFYRFLFPVFWRAVAPRRATHGHSAG